MLSLVRSPPLSVHTVPYPMHSSPIPRTHSPIHFKNHSPPSTPKPAQPNNSTPRLTVTELTDLLDRKAGSVAFTVDHDDFEQSTLQLLKLAFPSWFTSSHDPVKHLKLSQCTEGITNKRKNINIKFICTQSSFCSNEM